MQLKYDPSAWGELFRHLDETLKPEQQLKFGVNQNDPVECWLAIGARMQHQPALAHLVREVCGCTVRSIIWSDYSCACSGLKTLPADSQTSAMHLELTAPPEHADCSLSELLEAEGNAEAVDIDANPSCPHCAKPATNSRTLHLTDARDVLMISINRCAVLRQERQGADPIFNTRNLFTRVLPDTELQIGDSRFMLKSIVVHRGKDPTGGHYVCYARHDAQTYCCYNDGRPVLTNIHRELPEEAYTSSRLFVYENQTHCWPSLKPTPVQQVRGAVNLFRVCDLSYCYLRCLLSLLLLCLEGCRVWHYE